MAAAWVDSVSVKAPNDKVQSTWRSKIVYGHEKSGLKRHSYLLITDPNSKASCSCADAAEPWAKHNSFRVKGETKSL